MRWSRLPTIVVAACLAAYELEGTVVATTKGAALDHVALAPPV